VRPTLGSQRCWLTSSLPRGLRVARRRRYLTVEAARSSAVQIADATFAVRRHGLWGAGSTAVASDSTHVRALDQDLLTEWHSRYHGRGVLI
jgi:TnpA family transposase